jgi:hypothetical protein
LFALAASGIGPDLEVKTYVEGDMYHIDGLVLDGEGQFCWPFKYINGCKALQSQGFNSSCLLVDSNPLTVSLIHYIKKVLSLLTTP